MASAVLFSFVVFFALVAVSSSLAPNSAFRPSDTATRRNAFSIFNAVHSAMRQWGSSVNHNGMSFFLVSVPQGQLLYHGGPENHRVQGFRGEGFDWMAFELEHAQSFARSFEKSRDGHAQQRLPDDETWERVYHERLLGPRTLAHPYPNEPSQHPMGDDDKKRPPVFDEDMRGYFHTYRASRPLNLLYIDGMGAGKAPYGCLDTQDHVLLDFPIGEGPDLLRGELERAGGLCKLAKEWAWDGGKIDGFIRAEAGFEVIYCNFTEGLDIVSIQGSPFRNETSVYPGYSQLEFLRAASLRYGGFPTGRFSVDWSSMVSAFFYDINITNPDASRSELPRLVNTTLQERRGLRDRMRDVVAARHDLTEQTGSIVNWQGIVDMIVTRFSSRLQLLATDNSSTYISVALQLVATGLYPFFNFPNVDEIDHLVSQCADQYLSPALDQKDAWTAEDHSIYIAVETVSSTICTSLFDMHNVLANRTADAQMSEHQTAEAIRQIASKLMSKLQWTTWKECNHCPEPNQLCLIAMFPWGNDDDHFHPTCKTPQQIQGRYDYWWKEGPWRD